MQRCFAIIVSRPDFDVRLLAKQLLRLVNEHARAVGEFAAMAVATDLAFALTVLTDVLTAAESKQPAVHAAAFAAISAVAPRVLLRTWPALRSLAPRENSQHFMKM